MEELFLDPDSDLRTHKSIRVARYDSKYAIDIAASQVVPGSNGVTGQLEASTKRTGRS